MTSVGGSGPVSDRSTAAATPSNPATGGMVAAPLSESNLVCSDMADGLHRPILDVDMDAMLIPSSTPGHHHLYIDKPMSWEDYRKLLDVMAEVGILEPGYVSVAKKRKRTQVRTPWTKK